MKQTQRWDIIIEYINFKFFFLTLITHYSRPDLTLSSFIIIFIATLDSIDSAYDTWPVILIFKVVSLGSDSGRWPFITYIWLW
jgi:hypothetical protein